jgi:magnesium-transporting ATPase (P-type)
MKIHHLSLEGALQSLHSGASGLASTEAERRLREFGPNRVERVHGTPLWLRFLGGFTHFFALILWIAAGLAFVAEWNEPGAGMGTLGFAILGIILVNGLFTFWQEYRAEKAMEALRKLLPRQVKVFRDGKVRQAPAEGLVPGDVVLLDDGDDVPADCRLIEAFGVRVNNATVTGESVPQARDERPSTEEELLHSSNVLLAGTSVVSGQAKAVVFATGMHTEFGKIAHLTQDTRERLSPLQQEIARLSRLVALLSVALGAVFFLVGRELGLSFWQNFLFAIGIIVANVPEGLLPTVTLALAMGSQRMARKNALIRHLPSVETAAPESSRKTADRWVSIRRFSTEQVRSRYQAVEEPNTPFSRRGRLGCRGVREPVVAAPVGAGARDAARAEVDEAGESGRRQSRTCPENSRSRAAKHGP